MANFREIRESVLLAYNSGYISDKRYDAYKSRNPDLKSQMLSVEQNFASTGVTHTPLLMHFAYQMRSSQLQRVSSWPSIPALCTLLKRFAFPCRYGDMISRFARPVPELCIITNHMLDLVYNQWHHLITRYNHNLLSPANLVLYADAVHRSGAALDNCWGFIDGTVRPVCRPSVNQRAIYNGHKRVHSIKFQSVALPNGLVGNMYGPVEGKRHDSGMLASSGLLR